MPVAAVSFYSFLLLVVSFSSFLSLAAVMLLEKEAQKAGATKAGAKKAAAGKSGRKKRGGPRDKA